MRRFDGAILLCVTAILMAGLAAISWQTVRSAEAILLPALEQKADTVARSLSSLVAEAVDYGIPLDRMVRADEVLKDAIAENGDFAYIAVDDKSGRTLAFAAADAYADIRGEDDAAMRTVTAPIERNGQTIAVVVVGTPDEVARTVVRELWLDVAVLLVVALLVALELITFAFSIPSAVMMRGLAQRLDALRRGDFRPHLPLAGSGPLADEVTAVDTAIARTREDHRLLREEAMERGDEAALEELDRLAARHQLEVARHEPPVSLVAVRAPVFLFYLAEEMTRPFLPSYIESMARPIAGLSVEFVIALPIILFMALVAFLQPSLNGWTERIGRARSLRGGAVIALFGYLGTAGATDMSQLILCRAITAIGFATVFVSAQGFIVDRTGAESRARGIGLFVSAIMAAMLCGPPIGGIVADRLGVSAAFVMSAAMALIAYLCALVALQRDPKRTTPPARAVRMSDVMAVLRQPVLFLLLIGCALPSKMILIGVCFYFLPLDLAADGFQPAVIGRVLMLYGLAMLILVPMISRVSDERSKRVPYVVFGGVLSGLAVAHLFLWPQPWGGALMVLQIGLAQGISTTPQSALVGELGRLHLPELSEGGIYGVFRLIERTGTAVGPAMVALIWGAASGEAAVVAMGVLLVVGALLFGLASTGLGERTAAAGAGK
ncbi:MFS transporter [Acuticoccus mangrovi]|uniref:MFS transporter n=1 Tax=Acuticoccus mangrovi TaxID=2796142 RepID=A0A934IGN3_9HYPH|nr:MFS transporter [Acuticoccus mangrovi]MBJ3776344.1 MFS transporter [Acuticoccus mangrovi]